MKVGVVGVLGLPNAGKSTLVNTLVGEKVGIVTSKPQTTRKRVLGILNHEGSQIVFIDTPGRVRSRTGLNSFLQLEFDRAVDESDVLLVVVNVDAPNWRSIEGLLKLAKETKKPVIAVITKDDLQQPERVAKARDALKEMNIPAVAVSAKKAEKLTKDLVLDLILNVLEEHDTPLYAEDIYTTQTSRDIVEEIVREKCFEYLHQEIPFGLTTKVMKYDETGRRPEIHCDIIVERESHVKIVIGRGGENLGRIGTVARQNLEEILGHGVILKTHVRCVEEWTAKSHCLQEFGYVERI